MTDPKWLIDLEAGVDWREDKIAFQFDQKDLITIEILDKEIGTAMINVRESLDADAKVIWTGVVFVKA